MGKDIYLEKIPDMDVENSVKIAILASLTALSVATRIALAFLPNVKLVCFITIVGGAVLGWHLGFILGFLSMFVSDSAFFGLGYWTMVTAPCMGLVGFISGLALNVRGLKESSRVDLFFLGFGLTFLYDMLTSIALAVPFYGKLETAVILALLGLFLPTPYPMGPIHELTTGLLLSLVGPRVFVYFERYRLS